MGSESYGSRILERLRFKVRERTTIEREEAFDPREPDIPYNSILGYETEALRAQLSGMEAAQLSIRGWTLINNFAPYSPRTAKQLN